MPEMPEVETVRRGLMNIAAGRKIQGIDVYYGKTIENDIEKFRQALIGQTIERIDRRGKYLLFRFTNNLTMVSHLRMEGRSGLFVMGGLTIVDALIINNIID